MPLHPSLTYRDLDAAIRFPGAAFGFELVDSGVDSAGQVRFASLRYADGRVLLQPDMPDELHGSHLGSGWVYVEVADVSAHYAPAALDDTARGYSARDPEGNLWSFVQNATTR